MKILISANAAWNLAHFRRGLIEALQEDGHDVVAVAPEGDDKALLTKFGVRHVPIEINPKGTAPFQDALLVRNLRRVFRAENPDVIISYTIKNNIYGGFAARSLGIPFLPNVSGLGTAFLSKSWLEKLVTQLYRVAFRPLSQVIFQNPDDRALFILRRIVREKQATLVPGSGIDLSHFTSQPLPASGNSGVTFLLIARLLLDKGVEEFIKAARQVRATHPDTRVQLLGEIGVANRTAIHRETVEKWVAEGVVEYLGVSTDVRPHIENADCVVLPSYREGTPRTLLEAAAMGRPLVATDVPGCREAVEDGHTGFLCKVKDPEDLARAMIRMIEIGPSGRASQGTAGRSKMEREFDQSIVIAIYRDLIAEITKSI